MNLQDLNSGTPSTKQWLNPVVGSMTSGITRNNFEVLEQLPSSTTGSPPLTLTTFQFPSSVCVMIGTGNVICPTSAAIDAALDIKDDGHLIWLDVINRNTTGTQNVIAPDGGAAQPIPNAAAGGKNGFARLYFTRIGGVWTPLNN
jgi:hypothetical protein